MDWDDGGTEAEALSDWYDGEDFDDDDDEFTYSWTAGFTRKRERVSNYQGGDRPQPKRWRCLATGCNPVLDEDTATAHKAGTGHRVAKWPVRSAEGKRRSRERNTSGYYDRYNVGEKSAEARGLR